MAPRSQSAHGCAAALKLRELRPTSASVCAVLAWMAVYSCYALLWRWLFARFPPRLNQEAKKRPVSREQFCRDAAQCVVAITSHLFGGPFALWLALTYHTGPRDRTITCFPASGAAPDPFCLRLDTYSMFVGEAMTANFFYQLLFWLLRWERGLDTLLHHLGFAAAGVLTLKTCLYAKLATTAMAMEISSPFLSLHVLFRQLEGKQCQLISSTASLIFSLLFVVVRVLLYGYTVLEFMYLYFMRRDLFPPNPPTPPMAILVVYTLGWVLQMFWFVSILSKSLKTLRSLLKPSKKP